MVTTTQIMGWFTLLVGASAAVVMVFAFRRSLRLVPNMLRIPLRSLLPDEGRIRLDDEDVEQSV